MTKTDRGYPFISFEISFEIEQYVGRELNFSKKKIKFLKKTAVIKCSNKLPFETSFFKIEQMYWQKTKFFKKNRFQKIHFLRKFQVFEKKIGGFSSK